jgi:hypothetical protein
MAEESFNRHTSTLDREEVSYLQAPGRELRCWACVALLEPRLVAGHP